MTNEQDLDKIINGLEDQNKQKTQFISTVSHEFRTYITALSMNIQMLEMYDAKWAADKKATVFRRLQTSMKSMARLLDEVSFLSKDIDHRICLSYSDFDVLTFCTECIGKINTSGEYPAQVRMTTDEVPATLQTDSSLFNLIVNNLLINAVKFSPSGQAVEFFIGLKDNDHFLIEVNDKGIGIPPDEMGQVQEPFYRAKNALQFAGSGLGLTVVRRAVEILQGTLEMRSIIDQGTEIIVTLPTRRLS